MLKFSWLTNIIHFLSLLDHFDDVWFPDDIDLLGCQFYLSSFTICYVLSIRIHQKILLIYQVHHFLLSFFNLRGRFVNFIWILFFYLRAFFNYLLWRFFTRRTWILLLRVLLSFSLFFIFFRRRNKEWLGNTLIFFKWIITGSFLAIKHSRNS